MLKLRKKTFFLLLCVMFLIACKENYKTASPFSTFEKQNAQFKVRINAFKEERDFGGSLSGAKFVYEVNVPEQNSWKKVIEVHLDDPLPIDKNSIVFLEDKVCYIFFIKKFAITFDAGVTWKISDLEQMPSINKERNCIIQDIQFKENKRGIMNLGCGNTNKQLFSNNYGINWE